MTEGQPMPPPQPRPATLRPATAADVPALALLGAATFYETYAGLLPGPDLLRHCRQHHAEPAWAACLAADGAQAYVLEVFGAHIGYALLTPPAFTAATARDRELRRIYLLHAWQGQGLGRRLLEAAEQDAAARAAPRLLLGVWRRNLPALAFYARHGFTRVGDRQFQVGDLVCEDDVLAKPIPS